MKNKIKDIAKKKKTRLKSNRVNTNYQTMQLLTSNGIFTKRVENIRRDLERQKNTQEKLDLEFSLDGQSYKLNIENEGLNKYFKDEVGTILKDFSLPLNFNVTIAIFIIKNLIATPAVNYDVSLEIEKNKVRGFSHKTYTSLTKKEKKYREEKETKISSSIYNHRLLKKPYRNIDRDMEITELSKKKGSIIDESGVVGFEEDKCKYGDEEISTNILPNGDILKKLRKNKQIIRQARHRLKKAIKKVSPKT